MVHRTEDKSFHAERFKASCCSPREFLMHTVEYSPPVGLVRLWYRSTYIARHREQQVLQVFSLCQTRLDWMDWTSEPLLLY